MQALSTRTNWSKTKARGKCRMMARKYYPDEWCDRCRVAMKESEDAFKNLSNACAKLRDG